MLITMAQFPASYLIHIPIPSVVFFSKSIDSQYQVWFIGPHLAEMAHQSPHIEQEGCFCQFRLSSKIVTSKCAIIGRKWFPKCADFGMKLLCIYI